MKPIIWMGCSLEDLRDFPECARRDAGYELEKVQRGEAPRDWKPMPTVGIGVREIRIRDASGAYRVLYLPTLPNAVYVLHCFQKKSQKTGPRDLELASERFRRVNQRSRP
jgi:phage-related protein